MNTLLVRPVLESDLRAVLDLLRELRDYARATADLHEAHVRDIHARMLNNPDRYRNIVAVSDDVVVGFLSMVYYLSFFQDGGTALINELVVTRDCRNQGIGAALVRKAMEISKQDGMDGIEVGTEASNQAARGFYQRIGFDQEFVLFGKEFVAGQTRAP